MYFRYVQCFVSKLTSKSEEYFKRNGESKREVPDLLDYPVYRKAGGEHGLGYAKTRNIHRGESLTLPGIGC